MNKVDKKNKKSSNKSFGYVFFVVFFIFGIWPLINAESVRIWSILLSFAFLVLGFLNSKILSPFNYMWLQFGLFLGKFITPIIMALLFFIVITPIGLIMRLFGKDQLMKKYSSKSSYWIKREKSMNSMKRQY
jgi:hypothetical protein